MKKSKAALFFCGIISVLLFYLLNRAVEVYEGLSGVWIDRFNATTSLVFGEIAAQPLHISTSKYALIAGVTGAVVIWLIYLYNAFGRNNFMEGVEHGSAAWGNSADIKPFEDKDFEKNMILTQTERMSTNTRQTMRNNNSLVQGGSGSGKTRFFLKPNLMQMHTSYVVTDPKGTVLLECGKMLESGGFDIRVFNLVDFDKSMHYNPFAYIRAEQDILKLVNTLILNTKGEGEKSDFWEKAERLLYQALIGYIWYELPEIEQNFNSLLDLLNSMEVSEEDENAKCMVDILFEELEEKDPEHFAVRQYKKYKQAAGKTAKSILISCGARLSPFDIKAVRDLTEYDELSLDTIGDNKTALFIIIPDTDRTFNFLAAIMYSQMFDLLCKKADNEYKGRLPFHVRCLLDEFANIGLIPDFERLIATIRSREISACVIVQNVAQIKALYKDNAPTIVGNCDTLLFLGSGEEETKKQISEKVGKTTVDHISINESKGQNGSYSMNQQVIARDLITPSEVGLLKTDECLLFIRGVKPFHSRKFDIEGHKRYKELADYDPANYFDPMQKNEVQLPDENVSPIDLDELNALVGA